MTQPAAPEQGHAGQVITATTIGLALVAVEARVRQDIDDTIGALYQGLAAAALLAAASAPGTVITGLALISMARFHHSTTGLFDAARRQVRDSISAGYTAAAQVAYSHTRAELNEDFLPDGLPDLGATLARILADVETMFGHARTGLQNTIVELFDPDHPDGIAQDIVDSQHELRNRAQAAAGTAVHQGANDALQALFDHYQTETGIPGLMKRWRVTASDPCGMCAALDGTLVGINAEFDHNATTVDKDHRRVWRNLLGPPRHPNCRCQLELVTT